MAPSVSAHLLASIWMDLLVYGFYLPFYVAATYIHWSKKTANRLPSLVFFLGNTALFVLCTIHVAINCHRLIEAWGPDLAGHGLAYIQTANSWDNWGHTIILTLIPWFGTALFIYRAYLVWNNHLVIILPGILYLFTIGIGATLLHWFKTLFVPYDKILPWIDATYPIMFAQSALITGLIAYKSFVERKVDMAAGHKTSTTLSFFMRVFWDSAALYTIELLILVILYFHSGHPGQWVVQAALLQNIGIIVSIMAVRVHLAGSRQVLKDVTDDVPLWLSEKISRRSETSTDKEKKEEHV
ncbi:hypothetical protein BKA70DRAFT_1399787 [Coprinopsis sp. MPI-PUGE-AT-0042]|nr:hypothetical protein BKA70DRAFT_1399787 [Coprinopsis sp. MPI-PUGE-AT-0042]